MFRQSAKAGTILGILMLLLSFPAFGYPHNGDEFSLKQPDGSRVDVRVFGDEFYQDVETPDGYTLVRDASGWICYAEVAAGGLSYTATSLRYTGVQNGLHKSVVPPRLTPHLRINPEAVQRRQEAARKTLWPASAHNALGKMALVDNVKAGADTVYGLTLLIDFPDVKSPIPQAEIVDFCNTTGYKNYSNYGSVRDFYDALSDKKLVYMNVVTPFVTAPNNKSYYDIKSGYGPDQEMENYALNKLLGQGFDFSKLTKRNNQFVAFNVLYAGSPDNGWANGLWPHSAWYSGSFRYNGTGFGSYQITNIGTALSIGTFCHENGHMLMGWPDLYAYDGHSNGAGNFCVMSYMDSKCPQMPNPYFRGLKGYITITDIAGGSLGSLYSHVANSPTAYRYDGNGHGSTAESFYIEARRKKDWSAKLPAEGLIIWHVDKNGRNTAAGYNDLVAVEQADNRTDIEKKANFGDAADSWRAGSKARFSDTTLPNAKWHNNAASGADIAGISAIADTMTFSLGINANPWIKVGAPAQNAQWRQRTVCQITWTDNFTDNVRIDLFKGSSTTPVRTIAASVPNISPYAWTIPDSVAAGTDYAIVVTSTKSASVTAKSAVFSIVAYIPLLTVNGGSGSGNFASGTTAPITAAAPESCKVFDAWTGDAQWVADAHSSNTSIVMPDSDAFVTATYTDASPDGILMPAGTGNRDTVRDTMFYDNAGKCAEYTTYFTGEVTFVPRTAGTKVQMEFLTFAIEDTSKGAAWDTLKIFNGNSVTAPLLGAYWGKRSPGKVVSTAANGSLTVHFYSDEWVVGEGWTAHITVVPKTASSQHVARVPLEYGLDFDGRLVRYAVPFGTQVLVPMSIRLYNMKGQLVRVLVQDNVSPGYHTVSLDAVVPVSGVYVCRMQCLGIRRSVILNVFK